MNSADLLVDAYGRIHELVYHAVDGLTADQLSFQIDDDTNSIAWLIWHLSRVQDDHIAAVAGNEQLWTAEDWVKRFSLPFDPQSTGYGHSSDEVAAVRVDSGNLLTGYYDAVHTNTMRFISRLTDDELDGIVDRAWNPPVTLGVRLISVISDNLQHAGQAAYVRGIVSRS